MCVACRLSPAARYRIHRCRFRVIRPALRTQAVAWSSWKAISSICACSRAASSRLLEITSGPPRRRSGKTAMAIGSPTMQLSPENRMKSVSWPPGVTIVMCAATSGAISAKRLRHRMPRSMRRCKANPIIPSHFPVSTPTAIRSISNLRTRVQPMFTVRSFRRVWCWHHRHRSNNWVVWCRKGAMSCRCRMRPTVTSFSIWRSLKRRTT